MLYINDIIEKLRLILIDLGIITRDWKNIERFEENWKIRVREMSSFIPKRTLSILDIGCGEMYLKQIINTNIKYLGIDYVSRGYNSEVFDINKLEFPNDHFDLIFMSGFLEYAEDLDWLVHKIQSQCNDIILSYSILDNYSDIKQRKGNAWKNHLSEKELLYKLSNPNFSLLTKTYYNKQIIIHLSRTT